MQQRCYKLDFKQSLKEEKTLLLSLKKSYNLLAPKLKFKNKKTKL